MLPESTGEGSCPHMQRRSSRQGEEEEEGYLETKPIHQHTSKSTEHQLPQHLQSGQETVVGGLKGERHRVKVRGEKRSKIMTEKMKGKGK